MTEDTEKTEKLSINLHDLIKEKNWTPKDLEKILKTESVTLRKRLFDRASQTINFWKTPAGVLYADVVYQGKPRTWPFEGPNIDAWLRETYVNMTKGKDIPPPNLVETVLRHMRSQATMTQKVHEPHLRVARTEDAFYYDLQDDMGQVVRCTPEGWEVVPKNGIKFTSGDGMLPQVEPQRGKTLDLLRKYLSVESEDDYRLILSWLIGAFIASDGYPILVLNGGAGTSKSSTTSFMQRLVDPGKERREPPGDAKDIAAVVRNCHLLTIDNLQKIDPWLSDTLCRVSTGGTLGARQYYTLHSDAGFEAIRPTILNGIDHFVKFNDLMERSVLINLPTIPPEKRRIWSEMEKEFEADRPFILGAIFDVLCVGLGRIADLKVGKLPRLAGWAKFMESCRDILGFSFLEAWETQEAIKSEENVAGNTLAQMLISMLEQKATARVDPVLSGTMQSIWAEIVGKFPTDHEPKDIPKGARGFAAALTRMKPDLKRLGIEVFSTGRSSKGTKYEIRLMGDI